MDALLYLYRRQLANSARTLLRSPRRLLSLLVLGLWMMAVLSQALLDPRLRSSGLPAALSLEAMRGGCFAGLLLLTLGSFYFALEGGMFVFPLAEIDLLFPTPVSRRMVLLSKLARDYLRVLLFNAFYLLMLAPVLFNVFRVPGPHWLLIYIVGLTALGIGMVHCAYGLALLALFRLPALYEQRKWIGGGAVILLLLGLLGWLRGRMGGLDLIVSDWQRALGFFNEPLLGWLFPPLGWMADLMLAPWTGWTPAQLGRLGGLALFAWLTGAALLCQRANIYEAALGPSVYFGRIREAMRTGGWGAAQMERLQLGPGRQGVGFVLPPFGSGAGAVFWKQWAVSFHYPLRTLSVTLLFGVLTPSLLHYLARSAGGQADGVGVPLLISLFYIQVLWFFSFTFYGYWQSFWRCMEWLKPIPLPGWKVVLAYALPPVVNATLLLSLSVGLLMILDPLYRASSLLIVWASTPTQLVLVSLTLLLVAYLFPQQEWSQGMLAGLVMFIAASLAFLPSLVLGSALVVLKVQAPLVALNLGALHCTLIGPVLVAAHRLYEQWEHSQE